MKDIDLRDITLAEHVLENPVAAFVTAERALRMIDVPVSPARACASGSPSSSRVGAFRLSHLDDEHPGRLKIRTLYRDSDAHRHSASKAS